MLSRHVSYVRTVPGGAGRGSGAVRRHLPAVRGAWQLWAAARTWLLGERRRTGCDVCVELCGVFSVPVRGAHRDDII